MAQRPPFVDPRTGERFDTNSPTMAGYLTKQSVWLKGNLLNISYYFTYINDANNNLY